MIGHAVGDALGVPVEFCGRDELNESPVTDMMGFGSYPVPAGAEIYLDRLYGDWRQELPPEKQRSNHRIRVWWKNEGQ